MGEEMKFTKEEIILCKQVAGKGRREIKYGDWYFDEEVTEARVVVFTISPVKAILKPNEYSIDWTLLWTISDCLEFLRGEGYLVRLVEYEHYGGVKTITCYCHGHKTKGAFSKQGNKDEEACLKAVLAVLEEDK